MVEKRCCEKSSKAKGTGEFVHPHVSLLSPAYNLNARRSHSPLSPLSRYVASTIRVTGIIQFIVLSFSWPNECLFPVNIQSSTSHVLLEFVNIYSTFVSEDRHRPDVWVSTVTFLPPHPLPPYATNLQPPAPPPYTINVQKCLQRRYLFTNQRRRRRTAVPPPPRRISDSDKHKNAAKTYNKSICLEYSTKCSIHHAQKCRIYYKDNTKEEKSTTVKHGVYS